MCAQDCGSATASSTPTASTASTTTWVEKLSPLLTWTGEAPHSTPPSFLIYPLLSHHQPSLSFFCAQLESGTEYSTSPFLSYPLPPPPPPPPPPSQSPFLKQQYGCKFCAYVMYVRDSNCDLDFVQQSEVPVGLHPQRQTTWLVSQQFAKCISGISLPENVMCIITCIQVTRS